MKNVLVTGALGYVGKKVVDEFQEEGYHVVRADIAEACDNNDYLSIDITKYEELEAKLSNVDLDGIIHLASLPGDTGIPIRCLMSMQQDF